MIDTAVLRTKLRKATGQDDIDLPNADADLLLNQAYWDLLDNFPFREKEVSDTFQTVAGTRDYATVSPFESLQHLAIVEPNTKRHIPLDQTSHDWYEQNYDEDSDAQAIPERYLRENDQIRLYPTPDAVYTIVRKYWTTLDDLSDTQDPQMPRSWHELIYIGALWRAFLDIGDHQHMLSTQKLYEMRIARQVPVESKEEIDMHRASLEVIRTPYP